MMSGDPLILTTELQLCLVMTSSLNDLKNAHKAKAAQSDGVTRMGRLGRQLPSPQLRYGLCEASLLVQESSVPVRRAQIVHYS